MTEKIEIIVKFDSLEEMEREFENNLRHGGTFARGQTGFDTGDSCNLVLVHPENSNTLSLPAHVVWVALDADVSGIGLEVEAFSATVRDQLQSFVRNVCEQPGQEKRQVGAHPRGRLRGLSAAQQQKVARGGDLNARIALERIYGKMVWEALLRNSQVTIPEVARIARMGALSKPLLELICSSATWVRAPHVRRALLSNPKLGSGLLDKILRMTPRSELKLIPKQTAYSPAVRTAARKLLGN